MYEHGDSDIESNVFTSVGVRMCLRLCALQYEMCQRGQFVCATCIRRVKRVTVAAMVPCYNHLITTCWECGLLMPGWG